MQEEELGALGQQGSLFLSPEEWSKPNCFRIWES